MTTTEIRGRQPVCPSCDQLAWYALRRYPGQDPSYWLCKWCGYWRTLAPPVDEKLALPVYHRCTDRIRLAWHGFRGLPYREAMWRCDCGAELKVMETLRPYPRFGLRYLERHSASEGDGRARVVRLTRRGRRATVAIRAVLRDIERDWTARMGATRFAQLKRTLEEVGRAE